MSKEKRSGFIKAQLRVMPSDEGKRIIRGYPIVFNVPATLATWCNEEYEEIILPTALDKTALDNVYLLLGHNPDNILGRSGANMRLEVDDVGLFFECELPKTQLAADTYTLIESGILDGMSFGFNCSDLINHNTAERRITQIDELFEISLTPFPVYADASVIVKASKDNEAKRMAQVKELEDILNG